MKVAGWCDGGSSGIVNYFIIASLVNLVIFVNSDEFANIMRCE